MTQDELAAWDRFAVGAMAWTGTNTDTAANIADIMLDQRRKRTVEPATPELPPAYAELLAAAEYIADGPETPGMGRLRAAVRTVKGEA